MRKHREEEREALRQKYKEEQLEKQKKKEEKDREMMERRAKFVEKAKTIVLEPEPEERRSNKSKVLLTLAKNCFSMFCWERKTGQLARRKFH